MSIVENLKTIHHQIGGVKLIAATKQQPVNIIQQAIDAGQFAFGENYLQEALPKIEHFQNSDLEWHFIGPIQANKTRGIAEHFAWVHSVDRIKIAKRLNEQRPAHLLPLQVCIEINLSHDPKKSGVAENELMALVNAIEKLPRLKLRGLMTMITNDFVKVAEIYRQLQQQGYAVDTLSMGMSDDFLQAIQCGSTLVRIGSKIFGVRKS